jgi:hypothetical protein
MTPRSDSMSYIRSSRTIPRDRRIALLLGCAFAAGALGLSVGPAMAGCNSGNAGNTDLLSSANCQATASGAVTATAVGGQAHAADTASSAFGFNAWARGEFATAVGTRSGPRLAVAGATNVGVYSGYDGAGVYSTAMGAGFASGAPSALGNYSIAIGGGDGVGGDGAHAKDAYGVAIGTGTIAIGPRSVALGAFAGDNAGAANAYNSAFGGAAGRYVTGAGNTAAGLSAGHTVKGNVNTALGNSAGQGVTGNNNTAGGVISGSTVKGSYNAAFGHAAGANVTGASNIAIGQNAGKNIIANTTIAIGRDTRATAGSGIAIGTSAVATHARSVALGSSSVTNAADTISVGAPGKLRRIVNVGPAVNPTDAVNLTQVKALVAVAPVSASVARPSTGAADTANTKHLIDAIRRELTDLRGLVKQQQQEIAELKSRTAAAARIVADEN